MNGLTPLNWATSSVSMFHIRFCILVFFFLLVFSCINVFFFDFNGFFNRWEINKMRLWKFLILFMNKIESRKIVFFQIFKKQTIHIWEKKHDEKFNHSGWQTLLAGAQPPAEEKHLFLGLTQLLKKKWQVWSNIMHYHYLFKNKTIKITIWPQGRSNVDGLPWLWEISRANAHPENQWQRSSYFSTAELRQHLV